MADFFGDLDPVIAEDPRFEFWIHLVPQLGPRAAADLAISFVPASELSDEQRETLAALGTGIVATKVKQQPVKNLRLMRPKKAQELVRAAVGHLSMADFVDAWKREGIRPPYGAADPAATEARYCVWDEANEVYLYTEAWVRRLIAEARKDA